MNEYNAHWVSGRTIPRERMNSKRFQIGDRGYLFADNLKEEVFDVIKEKKYYFDNLLNKDLINELLNLTKNVGSYIFGNGSLILKIHIKTQNNGKKKIKQN